MQKKSIKMIIIYGLIVLYFSLLENEIMAVKILKTLVMIYIAVISIVINKTIDKKKEIEKKFAIIAIFFGVILVFIIPILHGIDEGAHFFKVYSFFNDIEIVQSEDGGVLYEVPNTLLEENINYRKEIQLIGTKIDKTDTTVTDKYLGGSLYSGVSYITYLLPMFICHKVLNLEIVSTVIIGRLFSFIIWLLISIFTIKVIPKRKEFIAFLCLLPINLTLVTTFTGDLITNSTILLFMAYWYKLYEEKRPIKFNEIIIITLLGILSACSKMVYTLIFLMIFLLPKENFKSRKSKICVTSFIILILAITVFINLGVVGGNLMDAYPEIVQQKQWITSNIIEYIFIFLKTIITSLFTYVLEFITGKGLMLQNSVWINDILAFAYLSILILSLFTEKIEIKLNKLAKILIALIIITIIVVIFTSLYLQWTAMKYGIGNDFIMGVQGRYFFPIVALLILLNPKKYYVNIKKNYLWKGVIMINFIVLLKIIITF